MSQFQEVIIQHVPREKNTRADLLSKLASTKPGSGNRAQLLDPFFYKDTCPSLQSTVRQVLLNVSKGPGKDERLFASLIRLHFHDCFVQGCDGSILLNDTASIRSEQLAAPNLDSIRRLDVINLIKENIEKACPGVVSCADIVALAAEVSSEMSNGPTWQVPLGRRDSETASFDLANSDIPGPKSNLPQLISAFQKKGLDMNDLVALSGAHTIGRGRCTLSRRRNCKNNGSKGENVTNLDQITAFEFDNNYYINLQRGDGPFNSDQVLFDTRGAQTINAINLLASNQTLFFEAFKASMIKMSLIEVLVGKQGIIRKHCNFIST
ncbi:hypothetical protein AAHE18_14G067400 [Arachis hypogaea]